MDEKKCLKCGRPCSADQAFCGECLAEMERYPVKPGVVVLLPQREQSKPSVRRRHAAAPAPEEQIARLKKRIAALWAALLLTLAILGAMVWLAASGYFSTEEAKPLPGQNYSSETGTGPGEEQ